MSVKTKIKTISWSLLGLCCVALLIAAMKAKDSKSCSNIEINIMGTTKHMFIKQTDVADVLNKNTIHAGETLDEINLRKTEEQLKSNPWIKNAELFFDNHQILHVKITEREPVARVFTKSGKSFYIDSSGLRLPVTENATARVIVFTSFPSDKKILSKPDSLVLNDVKTITQYINADSFLNAQTAQINITSQRTYEITPVVGDQVIRIGNADNLDEKFTKLLAFYRQIFSKVGFERYSVIDVQYEGQVVAMRRGEAPARYDSVKAINQLKGADIKLHKALNDTTYAAPLSKPVRVDSANDMDEKNVSDSNDRDVKKPKAVMKKKV
ncbi:MAG TPA: FtsQ-type POTRA domain-containing protein [Parafilimonas sp.]|nr:FtsQ-type POTRA domain-containing protein [Parafilimonas sp.]